MINFNNYLSVDYVYHVLLTLSDHANVLKFSLTSQDVPIYFGMICLVLIIAQDLRSDFELSFLDYHLSKIFIEIPPEPPLRYFFPWR